MSRWGNSKALTQASYGLVQEHPSMNRWAVRAAVHGAVVGGVGVLAGLGLMAAGGIMSDSAEKSGGSTLAWSPSCWASWSCSPVWSQA